MTPQQGIQKTDYEIKAEFLSKNGGLRAYRVVLREMNMKGEEVVRTVVFTAPSWSHVAARYDHPEEGVEVMHQEFLAMGEVVLYPLTQRATLGELAEDLSGLKMCRVCLYSHETSTNGRCQNGGHRFNTDPASKPCEKFKRA